MCSIKLIALDLVSELLRESANHKEMYFGVIFLHPKIYSFDRKTVASDNSKRIAHFKAAVSIEGDLLHFLGFNF